jgi:hypothetical protein
MLLLFNTAFRPGYLQNILRTIFLPEGARNQYRYTLGVNTSQKEIDDLLQKGECQQVLVCYGDRFSVGGYTFYPVRFGRLESVECTGGRAYFRVRLGRHASCSDQTRFTRLIYQLTQHGPPAPHLVSGDPKNSKDGSYALYVDSNFDGVVEAAESSWADTSGKLAETDAFKSTNANFVFAKCDLIVNGANRTYTSSHGVARYEIDREQDSRLAISYLFPAQKSDSSSKARISVSSPGGLQLLGPASHVLDMPENRVEFPFAVEPASGKDYFTLDVAIGPDPSPGAVEVIGVTEALALRVYEPVWRTWLAVLSIAIYALGAAISSAGPKLAPIGELLKTIGVAGIYVGLRGKRVV